MTEMSETTEQPKLSDREQFEQILWYMQQHHPAPARDSAEFDGWAARLPDRLTHAAMMMLGTAAGHAWPGVSMSGRVDVSEAAGVVRLQPPNAQGTLAVVSNCGPAERDMVWLPDMAALASASGCTILACDPDAPLPEADALLCADSALVSTPLPLILWHPEGNDWRTLLQQRQAATLVLLDDGIELNHSEHSKCSEYRDLSGNPDHSEYRELSEYRERSEYRDLSEYRGHITAVHILAQQRICTPTVARERIATVAQWLQQQL